ncbi:MAG: hypothetical protein QME45_04980 [Clostridiales bacterium]|nr:hypothetical protein [Clostridiales bacterium]
MWSEGILTDPETDVSYQYWVKHYEEGSGFGIDGGRVSKLTIRRLNDSRDVVNYDRGWDVHCPDEYEIKSVYATILEKYN